MPSPFVPRSMGIFSIHVVGTQLIDISGFSSCGLLEIRLISYPGETMCHLAPWGLSFFDTYEDLRLAEDIKNEILALLEDKELSWLRRPFVGNYSMFIRHNGQPALYWLGRDMER
ncbi:MAG: hypothetical protein PHO79_01350 [Desulfoplanes sp.]|nr:hypothetical protein [Desulfoplanes sp.]MDD4648656.1 hypothetical protein [Desulfoplanes sp.]